jgi:uncharacterized circularly permuted ATP-grasp superfamily protein
MSDRLVGESGMAHGSAREAPMDIIPSNLSRASWKVLSRRT